MDKNRWFHGCYSKVALSMGKDSSQVFSDSLEISFFVRPDLTKVEHLLNENMKTFPSCPKHFLSRKQAANFFNTSYLV